MKFSQSINDSTDACNFFGKISVYDDHGGVALAQEEGAAIAKALGKDSIGCILQNHGYVFHVLNRSSCSILYGMADHSFLGSL